MGCRHQVGLRPAAAILIALPGLALLVACAGGGGAAGGGQPGPRVVLERGHLGRRPWQLVGWEQGGSLGLALDGATQKMQYSGAVGFAPGPAAGYWFEGLGPAGSYFYYGPAPGPAKYAVLTAPGQVPVVVPTQPLPDQDELPRGRFFVIDPPGPVHSWNVTLKNAAGHKVPFTEF
jgi:hypothetical protein